MSKFPAFFIDDQVLIDYLRAHGKGANTTDYELAMAVWINRVYSAATKKQHCIAFEMNESLPASFDFKNPEHIRKALEGRKTDTPIDFILVEGTPAQHLQQGFGFQLKRFPHKKTTEAEFINDLISFINAKAGRSRPDEVALVIIPEPEGGFSFSREQLADINKRVQVHADSFKKVILVLGSAGKVSLVEVYPDVYYLPPLNQ